MFDFFKRKEDKGSSAESAKERLQLVIARQRLTTNDDRSGSSIDPKLLYKIQAEILLVLEKYVTLNRDDVKVDVQNLDDDIEVLEVSVPIADEKVALLGK